ncbi:ParB/RepB/Spo0J family partition protein [Microbacterium trichothecenolyticum]|uniref:ParB/RepB/Spo0J family partition protein n=1 Tax=Microbacterium trichothecenolyticum TaxID=69370 RepID=UPI001C6F18FE|nr:ParB/RepB/Spo0J family partition protein [Microbacterium trichothecenolyticum]MBW9118866.1 ParB/RepB/Spo0J family partition protein [Microbacterium trichothecenolyticum]
MTTTPTEQELQILHVDPKTLGVLDQARADATPDEELVASVKQHGIMQPPTAAYDDEQGCYVILFGHRRVGAAIAAGLAKIPVIVRPDWVDHEALKLEQQIVENERRKALTPAELAQGYKRLELFGKTPAEIAAELGEKPEKIRCGLKIHASAAATQLVADEPAIDFEQAAIIAEFDEHPKLQRKLIETATTNPANFKRDVENQRTQREVDNRVNKLKAQLDADGTLLADVVTYSADWWRGKGMSSDGKGRSLDRLGIRVEEHIECPGHAAIIHNAQAYSLKDQPDSWILYVCTDWEGNGHAAAQHVVERTPEELERIAERERAQAEWAAQRELIEANTRARRAWIHGYLTTGRLRPTAAHFDVMALALALQLETHDPAPAHIALELLAGEPVERRYYYQDNSNAEALAAVIDDEGATPSLRIIVATAIATFEDALETARAVKYFDALVAFGYTLTDTDREHLEAAKRDAAAVDDEGGVAEYDDDFDEEDA